MIVQRRFLNSHEDAKVVSGNSSEKIIRISTVFITFFFFFYNSEANATAEKASGGIGRRHRKGSSLSLGQSKKAFWRKSYLI